MVSVVGLCSQDRRMAEGNSLPLGRQPAYLKTEEETILHFNFNLDLYESTKVIRSGEEERTS